MGKRAQARRNKDAPEIALNVQSNNPKTWMVDMLQHLYVGAFQNQLSLMEAKDSGTGNPVLLLVWNELNANGKMDAIPMAKMFLNPAEWQGMKAPDGKGGWFEEDSTLEFVSK